MIIEATATGKTVDEAVDAACKELGMGRDSVEIEVLELPKKGFLGLKHIPAKVRVYMEVEDKAPKKSEKAAPAAQQSVSFAAPEAKEEAKKQEKPAKKTEKTEKPAKKSEKAPREAASDSKEAVKADFDDRGQEIAMTERGNAAYQYVKSVVDKMGIENVEVKATQYEKAVVIRIDGEGAGAVIGKRGETLDALQYLCGLCANRAEGDYCRVTLDAGNYRQKRKQTLEQLARRLANNAVKSRRAITLEPMNPYERRIIHATVSEVKGATSTSLGDEPNRYVVISAEGASIPSKGSRPPRGKKPFKGDRNDRGARRDRREKPQPYKESTLREAAPKEAADKPLYGKIEL